MIVVVVAAVASGTLMSLAFPSADLGWLAWVALVPLLLALRGASIGRAAAAGLLFGGVAGFGIYGWLFALPHFGLLHFAALALYTSLYPACWCAGVALLWSRRGSGPLVVVTAPALWVSLDLLRSHAGFLALPWATLGQSQHADLAVLQVAALGGEAAVTFLVVMANVAIAQWLADRSTRSARAGLAALATVTVVHAGGAIVLASPAHEASLTVAAVQPAIGLAERDTAAGRAAVWQRLESLTRDASASRPALIVWPETAVGDPRHDAALAARLAALSVSVGVPIVVGAAETEKFAATTNAGLSTGQRDAWNSAYLVADGTVVGEPYRKRVLMPFGEYLPLRGTLPWPAGLVPDIVDVRAGDGEAGFEIAASPAPIRIAATICWESEFAWLARTAVSGGARILVQLTNDAWFGDSRAAAQHNLASVLRAVENGVPVVLASNTGPSQVIDAHGRVPSRVDGFGRTGIATAAVSIGVAGGTVYSRIGDAFSLACIAGAGLGLGGALLRRAPPRRSFLPTFAKEAI